MALEQLQHFLEKDLGSPCSFQKILYDCCVSTDSPTNSTPTDRDSLARGLAFLPDVYVESQDYYCYTDTDTGCEYCVDQFEVTDLGRRLLLAEGLPESDDKAKVVGTIYLIWCSDTLVLEQ